MKIKNLYKYEREDGGVTVSPLKPDGDYTEMYRLIADDGMELVKEGARVMCVDTETPDGWEEVEFVEPIEEE